MTKKEKIFFYISLAMLLSGTGIVYIKSNTGQPRKKIVLQSVKQTNGWGYCINAGKDYVIQQNYIPGITGYKTFISEDEALRAGRLVVDKMQHGQLPALTITELKDMHIHF